MLGRRTELWIAAVFMIAGLLAALLWVPFDTETPPIYEFRRQVYIGDALLPMVAAVGVVICAAVHLLLSWRRTKDNNPDGPFDLLTGSFFLTFFLTLAVSLLLMYWSGPVALALFGEEGASYRQLRATFPWKYLGLVLGGFVMVFGVISLIAGRLTLRDAIIALLAVAGLIVVFDVPFDTILLPPNGDF